MRILKGKKTPEGSLEQVNREGTETCGQSSCARCNAYNPESPCDSQCWWPSGQDLRSRALLALQGFGSGCEWGQGPLREVLAVWFLCCALVGEVKTRSGLLFIEVTLRGDGVFWLFFYLNHLAVIEEINWSLFSKNENMCSQPASFIFMQHI